MQKEVMCLVSFKDTSRITTRKYSTFQKFETSDDEGNNEFEEKVRSWIMKSLNLLYQDIFDLVIVREGFWSIS